ncbi:hypothetical protein Cch01nite_23290 [Cellulomonas chitinilytica]|uniref:Uncharacterized protein n=1 Tax=Cellulomonas chitinilytica TaxID=398759 RepID=A0A919TZD1_9CELL|nr:hypothetical protein [Cellulomonas chitinilytica]GIG21605.1 hypothetical protein Cch01nite_23290 [Cellulomonas chitinilytica]
MTANTLEDDDRPTGEIPALPADFTHAIDRRPAPRDLRYDRMPV